MANLLINGTFASGLSSWAQTPSGCAVVTSGEAVLTGNPSGSVNLYQSGFAVTNGVSYTLTFTARSNTASAPLKVLLVRHTASGTNIGLNATHTLTTSNATYTTTFTATLTESNARFRFQVNNRSDIFYIDDVVLEPSTSIAANFTGTPTTGTTPLSVVFTNTSTGSPTGFNWEYSKDGGAWTSFSTSSGNPTNNFTLTGTYGIRLTVTKAAETHTLTRSAYIIVSGGISAGFTGTPLSGAITLTTTFTDASTATNGITSREWFYNRNGVGWTSFSTSTNPVYAFTLGGTYDIRLTIVGPDGTSTFDRLAYVTATGGVVAGFTGTPLTGAVPLTVAFTDASSGTIVTRTWQYSRNVGPWTEFSSSTNPSFQFNNAGTYSIRLTVSSSSSSDTLLRTDYITATGSDTIALIIGYDEGESIVAVTASTALLPETDYFLVASYDQATGMAILYVDGVEVGSSSVGTLALTQTGPIEIGQITSSYYSNILLDELFFLNRAINPDEVRAVYESNAPVFAETSTWHWRSGRNRLWSDAEGLWMVNASGTKVLGAYAGDENDAAATKTWGGVNLAESDVLIGDASRGGYLKWDDSAATLQVSGQIVILAGSTGYTNIVGIPDSLSDINTTEATKLTGIAANATVGATWGTNINSIPSRFGDAPGAAGLYLTSTHLGYYNGSAWKAWIASNGFFYFGGDSGAHLEWNGTKLRGIGTDGSTEQWYANSTDGKLYAGAGSVFIDVAGINITAATLATFGNKNQVNWYREGDTTKKTGIVHSYYSGTTSNYGGELHLEGVSIGSGNAVVELAVVHDNAYSNLIRIDNTSGTAITGHVSITSGDLDMNGNDLGDVDTIDANNLLLAPVSTSVVGLDVNMPTSTSVLAQRWQYNGTTRAQINVTSSSTYFALNDFDNGSGLGTSVIISRNVNATTPAAGNLRITSRANADYYIWPDNSGDLRIGTTLPTSANDTSGTIVGLQSSISESKNISRRIDRFEDALQAILSVPLYEFQYKEHYPGQSFLGIVTDYSREIALKDGSPIFGMDIDKDNPGGKSLNEISIAGHLIAAVKEQQRMIDELKQKVAALTSKS